MKRLAFCVATHLLVTVTVVSVAFAGQLTRAPRQLPALVVRTLRPVAQTNSTVTLRGVVNPRGQAPTQYRFQYKVASRRHAVIEATSPEAVTVGRRVHARTRRLAPQTTYESRIVAWNRRGTAYGRWVSAKTPANADHGARQRRFAAAPAELVATTGGGRVLLSWRAPSNVSIAHYGVYRDGKAVAQVTKRHFTDVGLQTGTDYTYYVVAIGNHKRASGPSNKVSVVLPGPSGSTGTSSPPSSTALMPQLPSTASGGLSSYDRAVLADHPKAFWAMSESGNGEIDLTGHGHGGEYVGGTPARVGMPNGEVAVDFNGSTEYLRVPSSPAFSIPTTGQLTWEGWIRPDVLQWTAKSDREGYGYVDWMGKCEVYAPNCEWEARMYDSANTQGRCNRVSAYAFNPSAGLGSAADWQPACGLFAAGEWLYVVGEYQTVSTPAPCQTSYPGTIDIWGNGVPWSFSAHQPTGCMSQHEITPQVGSSPLDIGTMATDTFFPGAVGKVALYDYSLPLSAISAHYTAMTRASPAGVCQATCMLSSLASRFP